MRETILRIQSTKLVASNCICVLQALLMQVSPSDVEKGMKSPVVWDKYKEIINNAEGHQVHDVFMLQMKQPKITLHKCKRAVTLLLGHDFLSLL
jgi:hypothetical protein